MATPIGKYEVAKRMGLSPRTIEKMRRQGRGPRSFLLGGSVRWLDTEVDAWIARQIAETSRGGKVAKAEPETVLAYRCRHCGCVYVPTSEGGE